MVVVGEGSSHFRVDGSKGLAMPTPGSVELHEDVLSTLQYDFVEVLSNQHLHGLVIGGGDFFALHVAFSFSVEEGVDEFLLINI
jgi:hypothetical protein